MRKLPLTSLDVFPTRAETPCIFEFVDLPICQFLTLCHFTNTLRNRYLKLSLTPPGPLRKPSARIPRGRLAMRRSYEESSNEEESSDASLLLITTPHRYSSSLLSSLLLLIATPHRYSSSLLLIATPHRYSSSLISVPPCS